MKSMKISPVKYENDFSIEIYSTLNISLCISLPLCLFTFLDMGFPYFKFEADFIASAVKVAIQTSTNGWVGRMLIYNKHTFPKFKLKTLKKMAHAANFDWVKKLILIKIVDINIAIRSRP